MLGILKRKDVVAESYVWIFIIPYRRRVIQGSLQLRVRKSAARSLEVSRVVKYFVPSMTLSGLAPVISARDPDK